MADANYYELLGLSPKATQDEIRASYRKLAYQVHPDKKGTNALFDLVKRAYDTLSDPTRRAAYDRAGYVDQRIPQQDAPAPGWRRTDNPPGADNRNDAKSGPGVHEEPPFSGPSNEPPPGPPPAPPPTSPTSGSEPAASSSGSEATSNALRRHAAANPSVALLIAGAAVLVVGARVGGVTANFLFLGFIAAVVGFVGVLGRNKAAKRAAIERAGMVKIDQMTGSEFEQRLQSAFQHVGYTVYHVGGRGDYGADLVLDLPGTRTVVQAKRWTNTVGPGAVQEVVASRAHYGAQYAIVVTTSTFTKAALELARSNAVEMWDRGRLTEFLAAQELGPPRTGAALLGEELRAGAPTALRGGLTVLATLMAASASSSKSRRRRRR